MCACVRSDDPRVGTVAGEQAYTRRRARERFASLRFVMENSRETRDPEVDLIEQGLRFLTTDR